MTPCLPKDLVLDKVLDYAHSLLRWEPRGVRSTDRDRRSHEWGCHPHTVLGKVPQCGISWLIEWNWLEFSIQWRMLAALSCTRSFLCHRHWHVFIDRRVFKTWKMPSETWSIKTVSKMCATKTHCTVTFKFPLFAMNVGTLPEGQLEESDDSALILGLTWNLIQDIQLPTPLNIYHLTLDSVESKGAPGFQTLHGVDFYKQAIVVDPPFVRKTYLNRQNNITILRNFTINQILHTSSCVCGFHSTNS